MELDLPDYFKFIKKIVDIENPLQSSEKTHKSKILF